MLASNSVSASPSTATFSGSARAHVVVKVLSSGEVMNMEIDLTSSPASPGFTVIATPGEAGVGTMKLIIPFFGMSQGPDPVGTGQIRVTPPTMVSGGGTLHNPVTGYESQFGLAVTANGGQFQCQNTGRSAHVVDAFVSSLLGFPVRVLQMDVHGTVTSLTIT